MINTNTLKKIAEEKAKATVTTNGAVINLNNLFQQKAELILTQIGYHNFNVTNFRTAENSLTFVGTLVDDEGKALDNNNHTVTIRCYGDGNIFRQQYRDILEQLELPLNSDTSVLPKLVGQTFVVRVTKNARGYSNYTFNKDIIINSMIEDMNNAE